MIIDHTDQWGIYFKNPVFEQIFTDLAKINLDTPNGMIKNHDDYYFNVMSYETSLSPEIIESHVREVDIQVLLSGNERIKLYDRTQVLTTKPYDESIDCEFYAENGQPHTEVILKPGMMAVFFPQDIHYAKFAVSEPENVKKVVVKVKRELV